MKTAVTKEDIVQAFNGLADAIEQNNDANAKPNLLIIGVGIFRSNFRHSRCFAKYCR